MTDDARPLEGDGLTMERCTECGGLSVVMLRRGEPIAYVCPPDTALLQLAALIAEEVFKQAKPQPKKPVIFLQ